ncbi:hypothetical protein EMIHUDRAFT_257990, partial [Emiliania huxleyi CCMP1516]
MSRTVSDTASAKVGIDVSADAVLEVAARLRVEALKKIGAPTLEALRAADRCLERIAAVGLRRPLLIETSSLGDRDNEVRLTAEEILFQQADIAQRSADACITQSNSAPAEMRQRDREA